MKTNLFFKKKTLLGYIQEKQFGKRLDKILAELFLKYSRSKIKQWILDKKVKINNKVFYKPDKKIFQKGKVFIKFYTEKYKINRLYNIFLNIVYEDNEILVINKPSNLVVHPGCGNKNKTLLNGIFYHYPKNIKIERGGIVHRLDKNTTGIMVIAKTIYSRNKLVENFKLKKITREYQAVVYGIVKKNGEINKPIIRHPTKRVRMITSVLGKSSITKYKVIENYRFHTRLIIKLCSGRTHQIRVHMESINHPLIGDPIYKRKCYFKKNNRSIFNVSKNFTRQALHAYRLCLYHPLNNKKMEWIAKIPDDMIELINILRIDKKKS